MLRRIFYREFIFFLKTNGTHHSNNRAQISRDYAQTNGATTKLKTGYNGEIVIFPVGKFHEENCKTATPRRVSCVDYVKGGLFSASFSFN